MSILICGVDCTPTNGLCNGYCTGKRDDPPLASEAVILARKRDAAWQALRATEKAWHEYAAACEVGDERTRAFEIFENVRNAPRQS